MVGTKVITSEMAAAELARGYLEFDVHVDHMSDFNGFKAYEVPGVVCNLVAILGTLMVSWEKIDAIFKQEFNLLP